MNEKNETYRIIDEYEVKAENIIAEVKIVDYPQEFVYIYELIILNISEVTLALLNKVKEEFISKINIGLIESGFAKNYEGIKKQFTEELKKIIKKYMPHIDKETANFLISHLIRENLGLGKIEILLKDKNIEEIVINNSKEPVWVYHRKYGWLKTNILVDDERRIRHYATMIGRGVGKDITILNPLMDASLRTGDRVNATLYPISTKGNTLTIRKFSDKPWTIVDLIKNNTISSDVAAWIWLCVEYELSIIIAGGTASGKTSMLNAISNFFPPNQRIVSVEDTRELTLPDVLHWVPLETRLPNPEGKGEVTMLDLIVNSLRMRPDRIIVGEIRRKREAEVLFEAMHTGHSVYATLHANNAHEVINRMTNPPINIPKILLSAIGLIVVQYRNRRTGKRVTLQLAEILESGDERVFYQYNVSKGKFELLRKPNRIINTINLYTGMSYDQIMKEIEEKKRILDWMVKKDITDINKIGLLISRYYRMKRKK